MLHGQWYEHGCKVATLGELAHPQELFLLNECDDIAIATIFRKCDVYTLQPDEDEPPIPEDPRSLKFFCR
jgi:DNA (cytosine-5)-methyltransferase 1